MTRHRAPDGDRTRRTGAGARPTLAWIGLGGNLGHPASRPIAAALHRLAAWPGVSGLRASRLYRTAPWGRTDQPAFVNAVAELAYSGTAADLLAGLLAVEREAGRARGDERWGPRILDLDLLIFGGSRIDLPGLTVPHPRLVERAFVLVPLAELAPDLEIPGVGRVRSLVAAIDATQVTALAAC